MPANIVSGQEWLHRRPDSAPAPKAQLLLVGTDPLPRERICATLLDSGVPTVAIFGSETAVNSEIAGCCREFLFWPCRPGELRLRLARILPANGARIDHQALADEFAMLNLIGRSPAFLAAMATIKHVASSNVPILVGGETGTGKELAARAIHYLSARRSRPFVPINCGALPDTLLENELFGHERGAFTDAREARPGLIALAEGGTLFLDEVDALTPKAQVALLRFLQDRQFRPLGARDYQASDVRVIAASNVDLGELVEQRRFRQDLLFRLNIVGLRLPALRERGDDLELLAHHFIRRLAHEHQRPSIYLPPSSLAALRRYTWPGNVRELENTLHRALLLSTGDAIHWPNTPGLDRTPPVFADDASFRGAKARLIADFERRYIEDLLRTTGGNVTEAARRAGKERRAFGKLIKKYGLDKAALPATF